MSYSNGPKLVTNGLVLYLDAANPKSYIGSGTTWNDLSGNNNSGSLINGPTYNSANKGGIVFDGSNDYVEITSTGSLQINTNEVTVISVVKITEFGPNKARLIDTTNGDFGGQYVLKIGTTSPYQDISWIICPAGSSAQEIRKSTSIITSTNTPYVIAARWRKSDGAAAIFVNGVETSYAATNTYTGNMNSLDTPFTIGFLRSYNIYGKQTIYLTAVYNRYLSNQEILQNYNSTKGRFGL